jgi:hypothetical protein
MLINGFRGWPRDFEDGRAANGSAGAGFKDSAGRATAMIVTTSEILGIPSLLMRYRDQKGQGWPTFIDFLTM